MVLRYRKLFNHSKQQINLYYFIYIGLSLIVNTPLLDYLCGFSDMRVSTLISVMYVR